MKRRLLCFALVSLLLCSAASADEGLWLYNAFPSAKVKAKYKFSPTQAWLNHLRLASVRMGASASFVSPDGLVLTNHHVGANCVHNLSTKEHDYIKEGFYAPTREEEPQCPGIEVQTVLGIRDITKEVNSAAQPGMTAAQAGTAQRAMMSRLESECSDVAQNIRCETVTLYAGGMYHLYKYKKYSDVRLVMAPEFDAAFYGGDPDNFTYPRYDLDITFFRVYENGKPVHPSDYLSLSTTGVKEGDLVFISGNPGSTGRLLTMSQLEYLRDVAYPTRIASLKRMIDYLQAFGAKSPENARAAERVLFSAQNSYKALNGYQSGLMDKSIMAKKAAAERKLRDAVAKDPKISVEFGPAWDEIEKATQWQRDHFQQITYHSDTAIPGRLAAIARLLVRTAEERTKPNDERMRGFQEQNFPAIEQNIFAAVPIHRELEQLQVAEGLKTLAANLPADDPFLKTALAGKTPEDRAKELVSGTHLADTAFRRELYDGGQVAINAAADPMIALMRQIDPEVRQVRRDMDDHVESVVRENAARVAKARFRLYGTDIAPDATGTLRLSYGSVKGYTENGKKIPYFTTFGQAFKYEAEHNAQPPYKLPDSYHRAKDKLDMSTVLDTVNTGDSIGGNSGSPVVNTDGDFVGILFDGNIQSLPWNFYFDDMQGRSVLTDSRAIIEALRKIYNANGLADELLRERRFVPSLKAPARTGK